MRGHLVDEGENRRVIEVSTAAIHESNEHLLHEARQWQRNLGRFRGEERVAQIFLMQADAEARFEVARDDHRSLGIEDRAAGESSLDRIEYDFGVDTASVGEDQRFGHGRNVACHDNLIGELGDVARTDTTGEGNARTHELKDGENFIERIQISADHDGKCAVDRLGLAATDGRIEKAHVLPDTRRQFSSKQRG